MKAPILLIHSPKDLVFPGSAVDETATKLKTAGLTVTQVQLQGDRGHLDGVLNIKQAEGAIRDFLAR
jgi:homoserine O-acetyltransferase